MVAERCLGSPAGACYALRMSLLARDIMQPHVVTVSPDTTLVAVADLLINQRISGVPVVEGGAIVGIVSRSDFARLVSLERTLAGLATEAEGIEEYAPGELPAPLPLPAELTALMEGRAVRDVMTPSPLVVSQKELAGCSQQYGFSGPQPLIF